MGSIKSNKTILIASLCAIGALFAIIFLIFMNKPKEKKEPYSSKIDIVNMNEVISKLKEKYPNLVYESKEIQEFVSLIFEEDGKKINILIDKKTGKELNIKDLLKEDFYTKEEELLKEKYPSFIVKGILNTPGERDFLVKDKELLIYYQNYTFDPIYKEEVYLHVSYKDMKEQIKFTPKIDETKEVKDNTLDPSKKAVALTLDDGPSYTYNEKILEVLEKNKAHATFFMIGKNMNNCHSCVYNTYQSGNEVASHTYEHINMQKSSVEEIEASLNKTKELYKKITGDKINYVRPPYGAYSKQNLENAEVPYILWSLDTEDWRYRNKEHIVEYIKENVYDGAIILMHEIYPTSLEALEEILPWLYSEGYQVVSISELASLKEKNLEVGKIYTSIR